MADDAVWSKSCPLLYPVHVAFMAFGHRLNILMADIITGASRTQKTEVENDACGAAHFIVIDVEITQRMSHHRVDPDRTLNE
jgi:hypothetical protein